MNRKTVLIAAGLAAMVGIGATAAFAAVRDSETPITGEALQKVSAAALAHTGGGKVTDTEAGDEEGAYEVEVTMPGGREIDVHLNETFEVIGSEPEAPGEADKKE